MATASRRRCMGLLLVLSAFLSPTPGEAQYFPPDDDLELMLRYIVEDGLTPGIVLGLLEADGTTRVLSYGSAGAGAQPLGPRSLFEVGSITKPFVGALLLQMAARGEVALHDPVSKYLPAHVTVPSAGGREITLLDLATHRSGLPVWPGRGPATRLGTLSAFTTDSLFVWLSAHRLRAPPGTGYAYSNLGYGLLGHTLALAAGRPLGDLLRQRILDPLGMEATHIPPPGVVEEAMVRGHRRGEPGPYWFAPDALQGAGAMVSNMEEMLAFLQTAISPPATDTERAIQDALEVRVTDGTHGAGWGLSWRTGVFASGARLTGQGGATDSFRSRIVLDRDRGIGVVILTNDFFFNEPLEVVLLGHDPPPAEWVDVDVDFQLLARYAGEYEGVDGRERFFVRLEEEGFLTYQTPERSRARLYARSDTVFYTLRAPLTFTFQLSAEVTDATIVAAQDERRGNAAPGTLLARRVSLDTPAPVLVAGVLPLAEARAPHAGSRGLLGILGVLAVLAVAAIVGLIVTNRDRRAAR
jgi:serine-type D-Ala-D-Ala carboxypeptidase/endopeptidase